MSTPYVCCCCCARFGSEYDVEVLARIGRVWEDDVTSRLYDQAALEMAEAILKVRAGSSWGEAGRK